MSRYSVITAPVQAGALAPDLGGRRLAAIGAGGKLRALPEREAAVIPTIVHNATPGSQAASARWSRPFKRPGLNQMRDADRHAADGLATAIVPRFVDTDVSFCEPAGSVRKRHGKPSSRSPALNPHGRSGEWLAVVDRTHG